MKLSSILSPRNITLFAFILVVLLIGTIFDFQLEGMQEGDSKNKPNYKSRKPTATAAATAPKTTTAAPK